MRDYKSVAGAWGVTDNDWDLLDAARKELAEGLVFLNSLFNIMLIMVRYCMSVVGSCAVLRV